MKVKTQDTNQNRLITIRVSHYCEKARWALDYLGIEYVEENHAPPFYKFYTNREGGSSVPVLVTENIAYTDSTDILRYLDQQKEGQLYPRDPSLRQKVEELEELFDTQLGEAIRCWSLFYAIENPKSYENISSQKVPWWQKIGLKFMLPQVLNFIKKEYNITVEKTEISLETIRDIFAKVEEILAKDKKYLVGDRFSAADLTFAALSAPLLRPKNHPVMSSKVDGVPTEVLSVVKEFRSSPAGEYALNLYKEKRCRSIMA